MRGKFILVSETKMNALEWGQIGWLSTPSVINVLRSVEFTFDPLRLAGSAKILKTALRKPFWESRAKAVN